MINPNDIREFDDTKSARKNIYDNTLEAMKRRFPIEDDNYKLELVDLQYEGKQDFSLAEQKKAILNNQNLRTNLVGTWRLTDKKTGNVVDERRSSVMQVPYWTDRGTIINNGSEYTVISQSRLRPGVYTRKKSNGEFETQFNVKPGTGHAFHFGLNPETGIMTLQTGQGSVPLYQVLKGIGVEDKDIIKHWGAEVTANNAKKADPQAWNKLYRRWAGYKAIPNATELDKIQFVKDALATYEVDPEVVERTLGLRNVTSLTPNVLLRASQKLLNISRGDEQPDNRDNPRFSKFYGVEDYFKERIDKNAGRLTNTLFYKVKRNGNLKSIQSNALNPWVDTIINGSGLAMPGEEANPLSTLEQMSRISKFGLGGIGSKDAVTMEARDVQGDYLGFVDNVAGPECFTPGSYIMSKTGFIPIEDVTYNTELACLIDNRLEYHTPERVISEHYSGDIYTADTKFIRYKVTNNHRIWHKKDTLTYSFNTAEQVHKQDITLMTGGHAPYVSDKVITEFLLPHTDHNIPAIDIETWGAFLGYFLSTGSVSCYNIYIPKTSPEHINDLTSVLNKLPLTYTVHNNDFVLSNDKLALYLSQFTNERHIPDYMFDATVEGRKAFLNALHHSQPTNNCTYTTTSSRLAHDIERICFTLGLSANVYHKHSKTSTWVVRFNQKQEYTLSSNSLWHKCDYGIEPYNGIVYCVTVPGGLVYARYGDTGAHWTGNSEAIGVDVRASYKTFLGKDNKLYGEFINRTTGKTEYVDIATAADRLVAFPGQDLSKPYVMAIKDGIPQKVPSSEVKYAVPSYAHMVASNTNMNPMPTTVQAGRQFYGSKFWSQYLPQAKGEVPLVDTLMPDGKLTWREYYGRKVGTLKSEVDGVVTKVEDNMVTVKDSEGKLHKTELVKSLPFNRMSLTGDTKVFVRRSGVPLCIRIDQYEFKPGDEVQSYDPTTCRSAWMPVTGFTRHENGVRLYRVLFESGRHVDCTENHSLLTMADDFTLKPEYPKDCVLNQTKCPVVFASADNESEWTFDQGLLDGLYISEGCTRKQSSAGIKKNRSINKDGSFRKVRSDLKYEEPTHTLCQIAVDPMDRRIFVKNLVERLGGKVHPSCMKERTIHGHGCTVVWTDPSLASRWHDDFGMYADKKHIAGHVFSRGREYLHGLLAGYLAGDGCLGSDTFGAVQVEFGTVSEELQNDLVSLCNILGIFAMPRKAKFNGVVHKDIYLSRISTASLYSVKPLFGYPDRQAKLESILPFRKTRATAFDNLPVETVDAKKTIYKSYPGKVPHFIYKSISSSKKVAKHRISGCSGRVGLWANSDILWDTIVSIEEIPHQQYVYDFSVEGSEAFATANGTLVHNTAVSYFPSVEVGQSIKAGDMLAHSNFTDKKTGSINMGQNLHVAILPTGNSFEDAYEISEEAAKKMATDRLYSFDQDTKNGVTINRNKYISAYPSKFTKEQIETLEDSGIVKVGTVLHRGDPIVLSLGPKILTSADKTLGKLSKALRDSYTDRSQTWEHDYEGVVVDSVVTPKGVKVNVQAKPPVRVGDKLCYDPETEVLTSAGWKPISDVTLNDNVATLNPETLHFEYLHPAAVRAYEHRGKMYRLESQQVDVLVTPNHNMFVQPRNKTSFGFYRAESIFGKRVSYKKDGLWVGEDPEVFTLPAMLVGHRWGTVLKPEIHLRMETFLMLLGMFLSEGNCVEHKASATYGIDISQVKPDFVEEARAAFATAGIDVTYTDRHFRIHGAQYLAYFRQFGHAPDKFIPDFVFGLSSRLQRILLKWLMWGDGHSKAGRYICYTTTSRRLADDVQRLCLHCGYAANVKYGRCKAGSSGGWCVDHEVTRRHDIHDVRIITDKLTPTVNHGHIRGQKAQTEEYVDYDGMVYCCTMPKWHAIYVRRNGKPYWCGNSPAFGLKGVVGKIVPQDQMPRNAVTNQPYDILMNTMGFLSRVAPGQLMEISLGKVAKQTGKQIRIPQLPPPEGWYNWTQKQLKDAGVSETSDVFDPVSGKTMKGIGDGYMYTMAFHHLAEKKASAVGNDAAFTQDEQPAKGGFSGGKKMSTMDLWALLAHNAPDVIKDSQLIRGTKNDQYWRALQLGLPTPEPEEPFIYKKFLNTLRAGGVNVTEKGSITSIMPQTDKDVEQLSQGRVITSSDMVDSDFEPVKGGLFDLGKTGGMSGNQWSMIQLPEPVPNPIMEEPVRRLLGLTVDKMENILAGRDKLNGKTGGTALKEALSSIDVDKQINESRRNISTLRGQKRDDAVKIYRYLTAMKKQGLKPSDWMISKVPVLPPTFRPVSKMGDVALVSDMNELYKDIIENSKNFEDLRKEVDDSALADERLNIYNSVKAAYGLGESISPENAAKGIKGAIKQVVGSRPKHGLFQSKVLSKAVDGVARGVISPDMNLDMDQCGIPETMAWPMYKPYVMRELIRNGYPSVQAVKMIADRTDTARSVLRKVMSQRPVILDRAPTWHKFNIMAFKPFLTEGDTIRVSPLIVSGFNADFDGDQMNAHVPSSDKAVQQALNKMLPSKNLTSLTDLSSPRHTPSKEQIFGLYALTKGMDNTKQVKVFNSVSEAKQAYARGEIGPNDPIEIR